MKCLECKWDDSLAPREGKCCCECGLCRLCEQATLYKKASQQSQDSVEIK